jgi:hypothetical protein
MISFTRQSPCLWRMYYLAPMDKRPLTVALVLYKISLTHQPIVFYHKLAPNECLFSTVWRLLVCETKLQAIWIVKLTKASNKQ